MKTLIILTLVAFTLADEWQLKSREDWFNIQSYCVDRFEYPKELKEKHKNDKYPPREGFQAILCMFRGLEIWNDTEGYLIDRIMMGLREVQTSIKNYNESMLRENLKNCIGEKSSQFEEAYQAFKCFNDNRYLFESLKMADFYKNDKKIEE